MKFMRILLVIFVAVIGNFRCSGDIRLFKLAR
jgi:hypothetical protein